MNGNRPGGNKTGRPGFAAGGPKRGSAGRPAGKGPGFNRTAGGARPGGARPGGTGRTDGVENDVLLKLQEAGLLRKGVKIADPAQAQADAGTPRGNRTPVAGAGEKRRVASRAALPAVRAAAPLRPAGKRQAQGAFEAAYGEQRLQKVMAQAGLASRRHSEELIRAGRVKVNGQVVTELGTKVTPGRDVVEVDDRPLGSPEELIYILLNKPKGYVTTLHDPEGRAKVVDLLGEVGGRVYPVGRLDYDTEGLLLLTNDGELAHALMHPTSHVMKTYIARVRGVPGVDKIRALEQGIDLDDGKTLPARVKVIDVKGPALCTVSIQIHEGRNRQVRRMLAAVGHEVIHLARTTLGPLTLRGLEPGQWRYLSTREVGDLRQAVRLRPESRVAPVAEVTRAVMTGEGAPEPRRGRGAGGGSRRQGPGGGARPAAVAGGRPGGGARPAVAGGRPGGGPRPAAVAGGRPGGGARPAVVAGGRPGGGARPAAVAGGRPGGGPRPAAVAGGRPGGGPRPAAVAGGRSRGGPRPAAAGGRPTGGKGGPSKASRG